MEDHLELVIDSTQVDYFRKMHYTENGTMHA